MILRGYLLLLLCGIVSSSAACGEADPVPFSDLDDDDDESSDNDSPDDDDDDDDKDNDDDADDDKDADDDDASDEPDQGDDKDDTDTSGDPSDNASDSDDPADDADDNADTSGDDPGDGPWTCDDPPETDVTLPMVVDHNYFPTGRMGDSENLAESSCPQRAGDERGICHAFTYTKKGSKGWAGVFWQYPHNNWGEQVPGVVIPKGATEISFYAWSDSGGEAVKFGAGVGGNDSFEASASFTLTKEPKKYTVSLKGKQYCSDVAGGFFWSAAAPLTFYVDDIAWEGTYEKPPVETTPLDPSWPADPGAAGISMRVRNHCPFPIFVDGAADQGANKLERVRLGRGEIKNYDVPAIWPAGRINAYGAMTDSLAREKAELTFANVGGQTHINFNVTYVDFLGLPLEIEAVGGQCNGGKTPKTGCSVPVAQVLEDCPQKFLNQGTRCQSPRSYCLDPARQGEAYCHRFDDTIKACAGKGCPQGGTPEAYACSGAYANDALWCAAVNRGMTDDPGSTDASKFYQKSPYNDYAKWVHEVCPEIYAFAYDDSGDQSGFRDCTNSREVRVTFCPGG